MSATEKILAGAMVVFVVLYMAVVGASVFRFGVRHEERLPHQVSCPACRYVFYVYDASGSPRVGSIGEVKK